ncbi:Ig domain-containing protein [Salmonella enterica subsp. enterica]|nr:Ig domain-containing protein [Salmonella enterica]ECH9343109.1 Ig domain-containing protein [Salmonella enterica subsp. enterica]EDQ6228152.1 Ig domain-containing protein [Salmonella enterica subsp. enterica serovar Tucson]EDR6856287.1 Ig domain-containing protein [Salmonella enterica subsp. enterica]EDU3652111.1 Ig domain-containing protein [Salmonella enterica subsp. enterica serovar Tucson]
MRDYGKVNSSFWTSESIRSLSDDGRMLSLYLLTSPHANMTGCFRLPDGYVCEDLQWDKNRVSEGFEELSRNGFAIRDKATRWVLIPGYPNGTVDVFRGWLSSLGKTVTSKEVMTRSVKITGVGRPSLAEEDTPDVVSVSGVTVAPASATVAAGATTTLTFTVKPDNASDKTLQVATADPLIATVTLKDNVATVKGVKAGSVNIVGISSDGSLVAVAAVTVTAS